MSWLSRTLSFFAATLPILGCVWAYNPEPNSQIEDLEGELARDALKLIQIQDMYNGLHSDLEALEGENDELLSALNVLSSRNANLQDSLFKVRDRIVELRESSDQMDSRLLDVEKALVLIEGRSREIEQKIGSYRSSLTTVDDGSSGNPDAGSDLIDEGFDEAILLVRMLSATFRTGFVQVFSTAGDAFGTVASLSSDGAASYRLPTLGLSGLALTVLLTVIIIGGVAILLQGYWSHGFSFDGVPTYLRGFGSRFSHRPMAGSAEGASTTVTSTPFWSPVSTSRAAAPSGRIDQPSVDREYAEMLKKLGYVEDADRAPAPTHSTVRPPVGTRREPAALARPAAKKPMGKRGSQGKLRRIITVALARIVMARYKYMLRRPRRRLHGKARRLAVGDGPA